MLFLCVQGNTEHKTDFAHAELCTLNTRRFVWKLFGWLLFKHTRLYTLSSLTLLLMVTSHSHGPARFSPVSQQLLAEEREGKCVLPPRQVNPDAESLQTSVPATAERVWPNANHPVLYTWATRWLWLFSTILINSGERMASFPLRKQSKLVALGLLRIHISSPKDKTGECFHVCTLKRKHSSVWSEYNDDNFRQIYEGSGLLKWFRSAFSS